MACVLLRACFHPLDWEGLSSLAIRWIELILLYCFWVLIAVIAGYAGSSWGAVLFLIAFWYYCSILKPVSWRCSNVGYPIVLISCDYPSVSIFYTQACTVLLFNFFSPLSWKKEHWVWRMITSFCRSANWPNSRAFLYCSHYLLRLAFKVSQFRR